MRIPWVGIRRLLWRLLLAIALIVVFANKTVYERVLGLVTATKWDITIPVVVFLLVRLFRVPLEDLIKRIRKVTTPYGTAECPPAPASTTPLYVKPEDRPATVEDVKNAFGRIPQLSKDDIEANAGRAHAFLLRNGIRTKDLLEAFTNATEIFSELSRIYVEDLQRPVENPLDCIAVAYWGALIFRYGPTDNVIGWVRERIRQFPEYTQKKSP
ncbi:MAG: hypothetical protein NTW86_18145 [Candidatus Sumerlaeota bacterium]|nr:hypothetical protein [Candidatus Sumerlaeota bacterium]